MRIVGWLTLFLNLLLSASVLPQNVPSRPSPLVDADKRIERLRKTDATIRVLDKKGRPVPGAKVRVDLTKHAFLFGCAALSLLSHNESQKELTYQERFSTLFNFATILTYWFDTDPEPDRQNFDKITAQAHRLKEMGVRVKGHPLILPGVAPKWSPSDPDQTRALTDKRIHELVRRFRGVIDVWDVVGDVTTADGVQNGLGAWVRKAGKGPFTADALTWAREANPNALLMYNDYKLDSDYLTLVSDLQKLRAPLEALGLEAHMVGSEWTMEKLWDTAETFGKTGKALHFSEITVLSDDPTGDHSKTWPSTPEGERRQADYVEKLYTLLFSHPSVQAIAWWNFVDGDWDRNPGGLLRSDLSPKPAYERLVKLIRHTWSTRGDFIADKSGTVKFRGFAGWYRVQSGPVITNAELSIGKRNVLTLHLK